MFVSVASTQAKHETDAGMMHLIAYAGDLQRSRWLSILNF